MANIVLEGTARTLADVLKPGDLDATLRGITAAAVELLPEVEAASITVRHADGRLQTAAPTDPVLRVVDAAQYELREGPCYETVTDALHITSPHLAQDERFPRYRAVALQAGIEAQAGIRLFESDRSLGALNLYSSQAGAFENLGFLATLFAHQSGLALAYAREVEDLREAVGARQLVGQAVGIAMERYEFSDERAFAFLTRLAEHTDVTLPEIARAMIEGARARSEP